MRVAVLAAALALAAADTYYVMGDWGGMETAPFTDIAEINVANSMATGAAKTGSTHAIVLGDNFYQEGIETDVTDPRFKATFEDVFTGDSLQGPGFQFHIIAGNHDHYGNVSAEIAYTNVSNRWSFPQLYYTFILTTSDGATVQFVMTDTVVLTGNSDLPGGGQLAGDEMPGPADAVLADAQWTWIEKTMAGSTADYLVVAGHYPVWSVCEHGPTTLLVTKMKPLLQQYKATTYLAGHDHCAEYIDEGLGVQYHGIGASHGCDPSESHVSSVPKGSLKYYYDAPTGLNADGDNVNPKVGAFGVITVDKNSFVVQHLDDSGNVLYTAPALSPRN